MDRNAIRELFEYDTWAFERISRVIDSLPAEDYSRPLESSGWPSIAACLTHSVSVYDGWVNMPWGLGRGEVRYPAAYPEPVNTWADMKTYRSALEGDVRALLQEPDSYFLAPKAYTLDKVEEQMSPADILANAVIHERGHHGDLNTLFHLLGVRSYIIDYRYYRTRPNEFVMDEG